MSFNPFNPHEILQKLRNGPKNENIPDDRNSQKNSSFQEKKNYFGSGGSSSSSLNITKKDFMNESKIVYDREYIDSLLKSIALLENKVNKLEVELDNANGHVKKLQAQNQSLEQLVKNINFISNVIGFFFFISY